MYSNTITDSSSPLVKISTQWMAHCDSHPLSYAHISQRSGLSSDNPVFPGSRYFLVRTLTLMGWRTIYVGSSRCLSVISAVLSMILCLAAFQVAQHSPQIKRKIFLYDL